MILYILYELGRFTATLLPRRVNYALADMISYFYWLCARKDRKVIHRNLEVVIGGSGGGIDYDVCAREIFKNFARYLTDFFRASELDKGFLKRNVVIEGEEFLRAASARGKGVILLSAHIGNWEMGAAVVSLMGYPLHAVALTHKNRLVDNFFKRQGWLGGVKVIALGPNIKRCFQVLKTNGNLALLGDRGFSDNGVIVDFFGKPAKVPVGPGPFSRETRAAPGPGFFFLGRKIEISFIIK